MLSSILHRASGIVLYVALLKICIFLMAIAAGPKWFAQFQDLIYSPLGAVSFFIFTGILIFHLLNGIRHLVWDAGFGYNPKMSNIISIVIIIASAIAAIALTYCLIGSLA